MTWKLAKAVFTGGSAEAQSLMGKRIKVRKPLDNAKTYDPVKPGGEGPVVSLRTGQEGFVGRVPDDAKDMITVVFAHSAVKSASLDQLTRQPFHAIRVNWPTFQENFEIDV